MKRITLTLLLCLGICPWLRSQCTSSCSGSNTFFGTDAGASNGNGFRNTFLGTSAGFRNTDGFENTFVGHFAGFDNTGGVSNTFMGKSSGQNTTTGSFNTFIGKNAGLDNLTGDDNTFLGNSAGLSNTSGDRNTYLGKFAGLSNQSGAGNVFLGYRAGGNEQNSNKLYIANSDTQTPLIYGDFANPVVNINGALGIGIQNPERPIHLRATNAIFRIDRDRDDPGFAVVRYGNGFGEVWKSFYFYTRATGVNQGKFVIADWGTNVSGSSTTRFVIANSGNVGIGRFLFEDPSEKLSVQGNILSTGSLVASDKRFKRQISTIPDPLASIQKLRGVTYHFNAQKFADRGFSEGKSLGLIAQEVEKIFPELVVEDGTGYKAVNYDGLIPVLIEALKQQQKDIIALKQQVMHLNTKTSERETQLSPAKLYQNQPNPFEKDTEIRFFIPDNVQSASVYVYDMQGNQLEARRIDARGDATLLLEAGSLKAGMYLYALIADGQEVDTKRMIITR